MEAANMEHRDPYLPDLGEPTYLVIDPWVRAELGPAPTLPQPWADLSRAPLSGQQNNPDLFCFRD